jgi:pimeloyl-ACP methyl ester carboxylesterase
LRDALPPADQAWLHSLRASTPASLGIDPKDFQDLAAGMDFSASHLLPDQMATDLPATAAELKIPFSIIQGREDIITPTPAAIAYFDSMKAPLKKLILLDGAGHFVFMTKTSGFLAALTATVRPAAVSHGA